ncbi:unnamed protein product [Rotaria magnacalcarata]|uniref:NHL repeat containing protein n=1 Tax=Rotaria magnacalcarata TaxID=392030 RepID=A0A816SPK2_9BILA|nr:unnamed protein product [Rotaria magnacalcarata]
MCSVLSWQRTTFNFLSLSVLPTSIYALSIPTCATWNQNGITVAGNSNGSSGSDLASLTTPANIFVDNNYTLYITDRGNNRIVRYHTNDTIGTVVAGNCTPGSSPSQLNSPKGVAVDQYGTIIVGDSLNYRIQRFPLGSTVGTTFAINSTINILGQVRDLHINIKNEIFVTDSDYSRVVKYYPNNGVGVILAGNNGVGSAANQLSNPYGNFVDGNETLYVTDRGNNRVQMYLTGATSGTTVAGITGSSGSSLMQFNSPIAVIVDNNGYIYVADYGNSRIVKWTTNYSMGGVCVVGCTGTVGAAANQLDSPRDLKFDAAGNLWLATMTITIMIMP